MNFKNLTPPLFKMLKENIQYFDSKPFHWHGMEKPLTYLESTAEYRKAGKEGIIGKKSVAWIEHEVKIYQRGNPISRFIMDVVYQTNQKVRWVNYQKNKEFFETEVKEESTEEKPQPLSQKEKRGNNSMVESHLFPASTTSDTYISSPASKPIPDKTNQEKMLEEFKNWAVEKFKERHAELHKKHILEGVLSEKNRLLEKREKEYRNKIFELQDKYARKMKYEDLPQCLRECKAIFNRHNKILEQNIELLVAFKTEMQAKETKTKSETKKTSTTKAVQNPFSRFFNNLFKKPHREIVNTHREVVVSRIQPTANPTRLSFESNAAIPDITKLKITAAMPSEAIKKALANYIEDFEVKINEIYEKICLSQYDLYLCEDFQILVERKQKEIERQLEEAKKLYRTACRALHPDKLDSQLTADSEIIGFYSESFNLIHQFFSRRFSDLGKLANDPAIFFANADVKEVLEKHERVCFSKSSSILSRKRAKEKKEKERKEFHSWFDKEISELNETINKLKHERAEEKKELEDKFEAKLEEERKSRKAERERMERRQEEMKKEHKEQIKEMQKQLNMMKMLQSNMAATKKQDSTTEKETDANTEKTSSSPRLSTSRNNFYTETKDSSAEESSTSSTTTLPTDASLSSPSPSLSG